MTDRSIRVFGREIERWKLGVILCAIAITVAAFAIVAILLLVGVDPQWSSAILVALPGLVFSVLVLSLDGFSRGFRAVAIAVLVIGCIIAFVGAVPRPDNEESFRIAVLVGAWTLVASGLIAFFGVRDTSAPEPSSSPETLPDDARTADENERLQREHLDLVIAGSLLAGFAVGVLAAVSLLVRFARTVITCARRR